MPTGFYKRTDYHKKRISEGSIGKKVTVPRTKEHNRKIALHFIGIPLKNVHRQKISKALLGIKRSEQTKEKIRKAKIGTHNSIKTEFKKGEKHPNWQGGKTSVALTIRHSLEYKLWRKAIFERDKYTCIWCRDKAGNGHKVVLNADHIKPFALYPELRFAIDNGRTLCRRCHKKTSTYGQFYKKSGG